MNAADKIKELLIGKYFHHFENYGTSWAFEFDSGIWLSAQEIEFPEENEINEILLKSHPRLYEDPNSEDLAKSLMVSRVRGYAINQLELLNNSELKLQFENGYTMHIKTDTDIVDWHWSISNENTDPYQESIVACYDPSDFEKEANN